MDLYAVFLDLTEASDTISRNGLCKILARLGYPPKFLTVLRQLIEGQQGQFEHSGSLSGISNDVKQGCFLTPTLLSIFFSITLREAKEDLSDGIYFRVNLRRLLARSKTIEELITELLFANDCALLRPHRESPAAHRQPFL